MRDLRINYLIRYEFCTVSVEKFVAILRQLCRNCSGSGCRFKAVHSILYLAIRIVSFNNEISFTQFLHLTHVTMVLIPFFTTKSMIIFRRSEYPVFSSDRRCAGSNFAQYGFCSEEISSEVSRACQQITAAEVYEEEARIQHNIRALVNSIRKKVSEKARGYVHLFATSNDIMDTAAALRYKEFAGDVLLPDLVELLNLLSGLHGEKPQRFKWDEPMVSMQSRLRLVMQLHFM